MTNAKKLMKWTYPKGDGRNEEQDGAIYQKDVGIDPDSRDIGWYVDTEDDQFYRWRFTFDRREYRVSYNKLTKKVTGLAPKRHKGR